MKLNNKLKNNTKQQLYYDSLEQSSINKENISYTREQSLPKVKSLITSQKNSFTQSLNQIDEENSQIYENHFIKPQKSQILDQQTEFQQLLNYSPDFKTSQLIEQQSIQLDQSIQQNSIDVEDFDQQQYTIFKKTKSNIIIQQNNNQFNDCDSIDLQNSGFFMNDEMNFQQDFQKIVMYLVKGQVFSKFGRGNIFQVTKRFVHISSDLKLFVIRNTELVIQKTYDLRQIVGIVQGKNTENFKRYSRCHNSLCLSIQLKERSLDLEGHSVEQVKKFIHNINEFLKVISQ